MELAPKVQVLEDRGIVGHFEISLGNAVSRGFQVVFPLQTSCCFVTIHARLGTMPSKCLRRFPRHRTVRTFHRSKPVQKCVQCHSKPGNGCFTILFDSAYFQFAVLIEGDESSLLRMANYPAGFVWLPALIDSPERVNMLLRCP